MNRSKHTIETTIAVSYRPVTGEDIEEFSPKVLITFTYLPGSPAFYDRSRGGPGGWDPPDTAEVEIEAVDMIDPDGATLDAADLMRWALTWLDDQDGYQSCCNLAERERRQG